jgi:hypothetical protein
MAKNPYAEDLGSLDPLKALADTPRKIQKLTAGWSKAKWEKSYAPGKWSARRILVHLAQAELALTTRVRFAASQDGYVAQPFDQDAWLAPRRSRRRRDRRRRLRRAAPLQPGDVQGHDAETAEGVVHASRVRRADAGVGRRAARRPRHSSPEAIEGDHMKLALRRLLSRPGYTGLIVVIVAVGIGAATTVFSVVDQLILRPPPFAHADRLVGVLDTNRVTGGGGNSLTPEKIAGWQAQPAIFERFEAYAPATFDITGDAEPERITGEYVSLGLLSMLGVQPRLGRDFTSGDGRPGGERIVIVSDDIWRRRLGRRRMHWAAAHAQRPAVHHRRGDAAPLQAARGEESRSGFPSTSRRTAATRRCGISMDWRGSRRPRSRAREADGERHRRSAAEGDAARALVGPDSREEGGRVRRFHDQDGAVRAARRRGFVLFITCANVANLFLSHAPLRLREMAICSALGSGRGRLIRGVLAETLLLAGAGGALGVLLAQWGVGAMIAAAPPGWRHGRPLPSKWTAASWRRPSR